MTDTIPADDPMAQHVDVDAPLILSVAEAAPVLGLTVNTAHRLIREHNFPVPVYRIGARWKVPTGPILALAAGTIAPGHYPAPASSSHPAGSTTPAPTTAFPEAASAPLPGAEGAGTP